MADSNTQNLLPRTTAVDDSNSANVAGFLPTFYRTDSNKKFLQATMTQLAQPGTVNKVSGYIGRVNSKATSSSDVFVKAPSKIRQDYQLEPGFVITDDLDNTTFLRDYQDYINQLKVFGADVTNHPRLNKQEFYSWNPHIDWDKFVNFQNYYWLPNGPDIITISSAIRVESISSTFTVDLNDNSYIFTPDGMTNNPVITLYKGCTYYFNINSEGNPFSIKTSRVEGPLERYTNIGLTNNTIETGVITFTVPVDGLTTLYYVNENNANAGGVLLIADPLTSGTIDVESTILGKRDFTFNKSSSDNGTTLSNGMKVRFVGNVIPESYKSGRYYVEGVGESIQLINEAQLEVVTRYTTQKEMLFDIPVFDSTPFSDAVSFSGTPDYMTINRGSQDKNCWSRNNRWFHKDVIEISAGFNNIYPTYDQSMRAARPIIEFEKNLKLFNCGITAIDDISLIDHVTTDVFSTVEGSLGYRIDSVPIAHGQRVIFTADTDVFVANNIYRAEFIDVRHTTSSKTVSSVGTISVIEVDGAGWRATITGMNSTTGLTVGSVITATPAGGKLSSSTTGTAVVTKIISNTSIEYTVVSGVTPPLYGLIKNITSLLNSRQLRLVLESTPELNQVVLVQNGITSQGLLYWYNGTTWKLCQQKLAINQPPLFDVVDVVDNNYISFGDKSVYTGSTFIGTPLFSYKISSSGAIDSKLGFPISYKNINNIGDIVFNFPLISDSFNYDLSGNTILKTIDTGFVVISHPNGSISYENGWLTASIDNQQAAVQVYRNSNKVNNFDISMFDKVFNSKSLVDITIPSYSLPILTDIRVYVNGNYVPKQTPNNVDDPDNNWILDLYDENNDELPYNQIIFKTNLKLTDTVVIEVYSDYTINKTGHYSIPINLQNNPLNDVLTEFTLGEVIDHVDSIVDNIRTRLPFVGTYPGRSNLRDLGKVSAYGTKFVQHGGPISLSLYHITSTNNSLIRAIELARNDYTKFKRSFMVIAERLGIDTDIRSHVDAILLEINKDTPATAPYYFSDMIPYGAAITTEFTVYDSEINVYSLSTVFTLDHLSNKAVSVYVNDIQILHGRDYTFSSQGFVEISAILTIGDTITIVEYDTTDGCLVPATPTKLGMWPKYEPKIYNDTSLVIPRMMIQGHDGSLLLAYGDYRDDLILEVEKRIYNNIKVEYDKSIFNIHDFIPNYYQKQDYSLTEFNSVIMPDFYQWSSVIGIDFSTALTYDATNSFTFAYKNHYTPDGQLSPRYWRGIYQWMLGTDRPHMCPWEILGFSVEPTWWVSVYGPAPYTKDNLVLWNDLSNGFVKEPGKPVITLSKYARPDLLKHIPVDSNGNLVSPIYTNFTSGLISQSEQGDFSFGDVSPIEAAWKRHSHYPFSVIKAAILLAPAKTIGVLFDRSRIIRNDAGQLVYSDTGVRIKVSDMKLPSIYLNAARVQTAGLANYLVDYLNCETLKFYNQYKINLQLLTTQICHRVGAFTSKEKFNLLLDSKSPSESGSIFIPQEDYKLVLSTSSPITVMTYSGVIITKIQGGFEIKGYSKVQPYFKYYQPIGSGRLLTIGGISESYSDWSVQQNYVAGKIVSYNSRYYRTVTSHVSTLEFNQSQFALLPSLPIVGGISAEFKQQWTTTVSILPYSSKLSSIQDVVDFLIGHGRWLTEQGFEFNEYNQTLGAVLNWETSAKEFLFWTTHNWASMQEVWHDWIPSTPISYGDVIRYNGSYYKALRPVDSAVFNFADFYLLNGLDNVGSAVLSLSPAATLLTFKSVRTVIDDVTNKNNVIEILDESGNEIKTPFLQLYRTDNSISYTPRNNIGVYCASFYLVQKEHIVVIKNSTMFNDTIYNPTSGYKQDKLKVSGYVSTNWNGSLNVPGFIVDQAVTTEWVPWQSYAVGDVVHHKTYYYSATLSSQGEADFNNKNWIKLSKKPVSRLMPNWNYKASQFTDFYSLESENFDKTQQTMAQHLTGYQKRQYLENIIQDDVSEFKFYQGMIIEKGTQNVLNKLFDVLSADGQESLKFYEEWAIRSGQYGASAAFENIEFVLNEALFKINPQPIELVDSIGFNLSSLVIRQLPTDLYVKPLGYKSEFWPKAKYVASEAVYARTDEVKTSVKTITDLLALNVANYSLNDYILCSTVNETDWAVYQYVESGFIVRNIEISENGYVFNLAKAVTLAEGTIISVINTSVIDGFYIPINITSTTFEIVVDNNSLVLNHATVRILKNRKLPSIDHNNYLFNELPYVNPTDSKLSYSCKLWVDNTDGRWETWKFNPAYSLTEVYTNDIESDFGRKIVSNSAGTLVAVLSKNYISVYNRDKNNQYWRLSQKIRAISNTIAMSKSGEWLAFVNTADTTPVVYLYELVGQYFQSTSLSVIQPAGALKFGTTLTFANDTFFIGTANGRLYRYRYTSSTPVVRSYNPQGSVNTTLVVSNTSGISEGMLVSGTGFSQVTTIVQAVINSTTILLATAPTETPSGTLLFTTYSWLPVSGYLTHGTSFGTSVVSSNNGVVAVLDRSDNGKVYVYTSVNNYSSDVCVILPAANVTFGQSLAISNNAEYIAVSSANNLYLYTLQTNGSYLPNTSQLYISNPSATEGNYDKSSIQFSDDYKTIVVSSSVKETTFTKVNDITQLVDGITTFDQGKTIFSSYTSDVDVFNMYNDKWNFSERLVPPSSTLNNTGYGDQIVVTPTSIIISARNVKNTARLYEYVKDRTKFSWEVAHAAIDKPDITKIKQAFLYNRRTNKLIKYLDIVDPIQHKYPTIIEREVKFKTTYDPAVYSVGTSAVNVDEGIAWDSEQVGVLWWDKRTTKFVDSFTNDVMYRNSVLSMLVPGASVDIYEWVASNVLPADWDEEADTDAGLATGISGKSLYGNDVYTKITRYDTLSQIEIPTYYFWVKNKTTVPSLSGRSISAYDVSTLISNPKGVGYEYIAVTGRNSLSLVNIKPHLLHTDVVLSIEYWLTDKTDQNIHTQWKLISTAPQTVLPAHIERKWIDSLCGKDEYDRLVPDQSLPIKLKYGIENRPRQGMFVNRFEALKQLIEEVNRYLSSNLIVDTIDLTSLEQNDLSPDWVRGLYDAIIYTDAELSYVVTQYVKSPELTPIVVNGKITGITIVSSGYGYKIPPFINVYGVGINAKLKAIINYNGEIVGVDIINAGDGYLSDTILTVRDFAVLVMSDSQANNSWTIYSYSAITKLWSKSVSQAYNVMNYWETVDWYATGYSQFSFSNYAVNTYADLYSINATIGQLVTVRTTTSGRWVLLERHNEEKNEIIPNNESFEYDWTDSYKIVGSQAGTIQFKSTLYNFINTAIGYDGVLYDSIVYDNYAASELRIILNSIKDILSNDAYLKLFFTSVRYAMSEQTYIDWIFKTSFVNVVHNVGNLHQSVTYQNDNLSNYEEYVSEVKPYRTQIREYISLYSNIENSTSEVSDFDLPATYDLNLKRIVPIVVTTTPTGGLQSDNDAIQRYPWKSWVDNVGFSVVTISVLDGGSGYTLSPKVIISSESGYGATAVAYIANGKVNRIKVLLPGKSYLTIPTVHIIGGLSHDGAVAKAIAVIGNSVIRTNTIKLKFDRNTHNVTYTDLNEVEVIPVSLVTGKRNQFPLKWEPSTLVGDTSVSVNGSIEIRDHYTVSTVSTKVNGYTKLSGMIKFNRTIAKGSRISVMYVRANSTLNAVDRIEHYYNPAPGELGKDLAQLLVGIDYGGVEISGLSFGVKHGWDRSNFDTIKWDNVNVKFNDLVFKYTGPAASITIPFPEDGFSVPSEGTVLTVYYDPTSDNSNPVRIDGGDVMESPIATGLVTNVIIPETFFEQYFTNLGLPVPESCTFIIREVTSDGATSNDNDYDVSLAGGTFNSSELSGIKLPIDATGIAIDDIIIDGDNFENKFSGLEEVVPGKVSDSLSIKVYTKESDVTTAYAYMQFKDMLNRTHYKRMPAVKQTTLVKALLSTDTSIFVSDASVFTIPDPVANKPGIIEINGERIEFFIKNGNILSQLRRGTLGTGISDYVNLGANVQELGASETVPYTDNTITEQCTKQRNTVVEVNSTSPLYRSYGKSIVVLLSFIPKKATTIWKGVESADIVSKGFGQCNDIEVFVGGYDDSSSWITGTDYNVNDIVTYGSYTYKCKEEHTSSTFTGDYIYWEFFVGNIRLQKAPYKVYNERLGIEETLPADFSVNGIYKSVRLTHTFNLAEKTIITVIKRTGSTWVATQTAMNFIQGSLGVEYGYYQETFDSDNTTFDNNNTRF